jgi:tRNA threonylcarbamoyladenosine modification (KEOPS) complex  Pcc1 subunit
VITLKATVEIGCKNPENVIKSIEPDKDQTEKFDVKLESSDSKVTVTVESDNFTGLLAGLNSYIRLIKTATVVEEVD